jgi:hypothetical protein
LFSLASESHLSVSVYKCNCPSVVAYASLTTWTVHCGEGGTINCNFSLTDGTGIIWVPWNLCNRSYCSWRCFGVFRSSWCRDSRVSRFGEPGSVKGTPLSPQVVITESYKLTRKRFIL